MPKIQNVRFRQSLRGKMILQIAVERIDKDLHTTIVWKGANMPDVISAMQQGFIVPKHDGKQKEDNNGR